MFWWWIRMYEIKWVESIKLLFCVDCLWSLCITLQTNWASFYVDGTAYPCWLLSQSFCRYRYSAVCSLWTSSLLNRLRNHPTSDPSGSFLSSFAIRAATIESWWSWTLSSSLTSWPPQCCWWERTRPEFQSMSCAPRRIQGGLHRRFGWFWRKSEWIECYFVGFFDKSACVALIIFFLLESTCDFLRIEPLGDEFVVFLVVLLGFFWENLDFGCLELLVADSNH